MDVLNSCVRISLLLFFFFYLCFMWLFVWQCAWTEHGPVPWNQAGWSTWDSEEVTMPHTLSILSLSHLGWAVIGRGRPLTALLLQPGVTSPACSRSKYTSGQKKVNCFHMPSVLATGHYSSTCECWGIWAPRRPAVLYVVAAALSSLWHDLAATRLG